MNVQFLGTSASPSMPLPFCHCDCCTLARNTGGRNLRRRSSLLINSEVLVDLGPDIVTASYAYDISLADIRLCLQTHPHSDHFDPELIISRHPDYGTQVKETLQLAGSKKTLDRLDTLIQRQCQYGSLYVSHVQEAFRLTLLEVTPFTRYSIGRYDIIGYPANHAKEHNALLYSIACNGSALFYGADTSILGSPVWDDLIARNIQYDLIVLDHTYGIGYNSSDHLAAHDVIRHVGMFKAKNLLKEDGQVYASHFSHEGIREHAELERYACRHGYHIAYDGLTIAL